MSMPKVQARFRGDHMHAHLYAMRVLTFPGNVLTWSLFRRHRTLRHQALRLVYGLLMVQEGCYKGLTGAH